MSNISTPSILAILHVYITRYMFNLFQSSLFKLKMLPPDIVKAMGYFRLSVSK